MALPYHNNLNQNPDTGGHHAQQSPRRWLLKPVFACFAVLSIYFAIYLQYVPGQVPFEDGGAARRLF
jgi:hypothetical protein